MHILKVTSIFAAWAIHAVVADDSSYDQNAGAAADYLASILDQSAGLWYDGSNPLWWNSANMLTGLIDLMAIDSTQKSEHEGIIATIYNNAPNSNPHATRKRSLDGKSYTKEYTARRAVDIARRSRVSKRGGQGFLNGYYDDEGWWGLALIDAYDLTNDIEYLNSAIDIWNDIKGGTGTGCGNSIWWDKKHSYIATIANELYFSLSAHIANRVGSNTKQTYVDAGNSVWNWLSTSGVIGSNNLIVDGMHTDCTPTGTTFTYNQGVILGGLVEFAKATGDNSYLDTATNLANAATTSSSLVTNGILHEPDNCENNNSCGNDGNQFKGVFVRNLRQLQLARPNSAWQAFLDKNAQNIWGSDLTDSNGNFIIGPNWAGPYADGGAPAHSSGMECLIAAAAVQ